MPPLEHTAFLMETFLSQVLGTMTLRPYFAAFFFAYFVACSLRLGYKQALLFAAAGYVIAWTAEYSSIHNGIPFGRYYYICQTKDKELWVLGIPFMDSMSFVFLSYASYSVALLRTRPCRAGGAGLPRGRRIGQFLKAPLLGALFCMYLDVLIDPLALRGDKWFLGQIYGYPGKGAYFGIPISNFIGWFVVGFVLICALRLIDLFVGARKAKDLPDAASAWRRLPGPALYLGIIVFNLSVALLIREDGLLWADILILLLPSVLLYSLMKSRRSVAPRATILRVGRALPGPN